MLKYFSCIGYGIQHKSPTQAEFSILLNLSKMNEIKEVEWRVVYRRCEWGRRLRGKWMMLSCLQKRRRTKKRRRRVRKMRVCRGMVDFFFFFFFFFLKITRSWLSHRPAVGGFCWGLQRPVHLLIAVAKAWIYFNKKKPDTSFAWENPNRHVSNVRWSVPNASSF